MRSLLTRIRAFAVVAMNVATTACAICIPPADRPLDDGAIPVRLAFSADVDFSTVERAWLVEATQKLWTQTRGMVDASVVFDLDFADPLSVAAAVATGNTLVRAPADAPYITRLESPFSHVLGLTMNVDLDEFDPESHKRIYLVADRLGREDLFVSVAMHEFLHALGLRHVDDESAVMAASLVKPAPTCLHAADVEEFCRIYDCKPKKIGWCE